eukprot:scaffold100548_cov15-Tisochrysis_lutea.AAC.1
MEWYAVTGRLCPRMIHLCPCECSWRLSSSSVPLALKASLERMRLPRTSLYMQHWPGFFFNAFSNDAYIEGLAACKQQVGISARHWQFLQLWLMSLSSNKEAAACGCQYASVKCVTIFEVVSSLM